MHHALLVDLLELGDRINQSSVVVVDRQAGRTPGPPARVGTQRLSVTTAVGSAGRFKGPKALARWCGRRLLQCLSSSHVFGVSPPESLESRRNPFGRLCRTDHQMHLEVYKVAPLGDPLIEKRAIVRFHQLETTLKFRVDPT